MFTELGDICKADLIIMDDDYRPLKVQVKTASLRNGKISLKSTKAGPNYRFRYEPKHANIYAVYVWERDTILYVSNTKLLSHSTLTIRVGPARNSQTSNTNLATDYTDFKRALRDCT